MTQFGGFTAQQMEAIARKMGFNGPMQGFNDFLAASPGKAAMLSKYTEKAKKLVEQRAARQNNTQGFAAGGEVKKPEDNKTPETPKPAPSPFEKYTTTAIENPEKLATPAKTAEIEKKGGQYIDNGRGSAGEYDATKAATIQGISEANHVQKSKAETYDATKVGTEVGQELDKLEAAKGTVSDKAQVQAQTALPSADATVQGQLEKLYAGFEGGKTPPWAAGAKRMADHMMMSRGLGSSSMAAEASTQTLMESALQIAVQDAQTYSAFEMKNLDNRQQAALFNAQAFLQMDLANLENEQQTRLFKTQTRVQSMFSDQAAENAAKNFNATSKNQTNQFFAQLRQQTSQFNANQRNTVKMANNEQVNAVKMFNAQMKAMRQQFNAENRLIIDQSNAEWRRQVATTDTQEANENNRLNAQLMTNLTTAAYNNLWQRERDIMSYAFTAAENAANRAVQISLQKMSDKTQKSIAGDSSEEALWLAGGKFVAETVLDIFDW